MRVYAGVSKLIVSIVLAAALVAAMFLFAGETSVYADKRPTVTVIGDSVPMGAAKPMKTYISEYGGADLIKNDCRGSRQLERDGLPILRKYADAGKLGDIVVIAMTTNLHFDLAAINEAVRIIGPGRQVVLVTGYNNTMTYMDGSNEAIKACAKEHSNVTVCDWKGFILTRSDRSKYMNSDLCHLGERSGQWYARLIAEGVKAAKTKMGGL